VAAANKLTAQSITYLVSESIDVPRGALDQFLLGLLGRNVRVRMIRQMEIERLLQQALLIRENILSDVEREVDNHFVGTVLHNVMTDSPQKPRLPVRMRLQKNTIKGRKNKSKVSLIS
jgi:hypothetical protein